MSSISDLKVMSGCTGSAANSDLMLTSGREDGASNGDLELMCKCAFDIADSDTATFLVGFVIVIDWFRAGS